MDPGTIAIIGAIGSIVSVASSVMGLFDSTAGKEADLRRQQLDVMAQDRALEQQRNQARLEREARAKRAAIVNRAGDQGAIGYSGAIAAQIGITSAQQREQSYLDQKAALAAQGDVITQSQISLDASNKRSNEITKSVSGIVSGSSDFLKYGSGFTDIFSSSPDVNYNDFGAPF